MATTADPLFIKREGTIIKYNDQGDTLWTRTFGSSGDETGYSVDETSNGGYIVTGYSENFGAGAGDVYVIKTDPNGNLDWAKAYGGSDVEVGYSVQQTSDDGFVIAGGTWSFGASMIDIYLIKTDAWGNSGGCNEYSTNTIMGTTATITVSPATIIGYGGIVGNPSTIVSNTATIDSTLCIGEIGRAHV